MSLDKTQLLEFLEVLEEELPREITLVAVGGTALTLLDLKVSTIDVDFTIAHEDYEEFAKAEKATPHGFEIDRWEGGMIFSTMLPENYLENSIPLTVNLKKIKLYALHPLDIVITKIGRLNDRDVPDIEICVKKYGITKEEIKQRATEIELAGSEEAYGVNLQIILNTDFN